MRIGCLRLGKSELPKSEVRQMAVSGLGNSEVQSCAIHAPYVDLASAVSSLPVSEPSCLTYPKQPPGPAHTPRHDLLVQSLWRPLRFNVAYMPTLNVRTNRLSPEYAGVQAMVQADTSTRVGDAARAPTRPPHT